MPIYEYYCPDNHRIYQFYAKTLAQGSRVPKCPDNPAYRMMKMVSAFAFVGRAEEPKTPSPAGEAAADDPKMEAAMSAMENEFAHVDENDPRAMARMMRRMAELSGEKIDGEMEEVVRKLEEGADPDSLEEQMGDGPAGEDEEGGGPPAAETPQDSSAAPPRRRRRAAPSRDPKLYDFE